MCAERKGLFVIKISGFIARMLHFEDIANPQLMHATPVIIRVDALKYNHFMERVPEPYRDCCRRAWLDALRIMMDKITGAALGYWQTDEITIVMIDAASGSSWMNREAQRISSVATSLITKHYNRLVLDAVNEQYSYMEHTADTADEYQAMLNLMEKDNILFHGLAYAVPSHEVVNVLMWRQQRAQGRVIQRSLGKTHTQDEMNGKNLRELRQMLTAEDADWKSRTTPEELNGCVCYYEDNGELTLDRRIPNFADDKKYITSKLFDRRGWLDAKGIAAESDEEL